MWTIKQGSPKVKPNTISDEGERGNGNRVLERGCKTPTVAQIYINHLSVHNECAKIHIPFNSNCHQNDDKHK